MKKPLISFIIPTFNEETNIKGVISSIRQEPGFEHAYEIIVVDNGSEDNTVSLAMSMGVGVFIEPTLTIGGLRNFGASVAKGDIFIFLDSDVFLTELWFARASKIINVLKSNHRIITGSRCGVAQPESWIEKYWFKPLAHEKANYINSGHLITTKSLFMELSGFREDLKTGEDYDFSIRAKKINAKVINDFELKVIHKGYPKNLASFIKREIWHGMDSYNSLTSLVRHKTSTISIIFILLHVTLLVSMLRPMYKVTMELCIYFIIVICIFSSAIKFRCLTKSNNWLIAAYIYYFYFWGRGLAFLISIVKRFNRRKTLSSIIPPSSV